MVHNNQHFMEDSLIMRRKSAKCAEDRPKIDAIVMQGRDLQKYT